MSVGGQIPNNLALPLHQFNVPILGTSPVMIDNAENRSVFSAICDQLGIKQPEWRAVSTMVRDNCLQPTLVFLTNFSFFSSGL